MNFEEVLPDLRNGAKIRRSEWQDDEYISLEKELLAYSHFRLSCETGWTRFTSPKEWFHVDEVLANDWEIYESA